MISEVKKIPASRLEECLAIFKDDELNKAYNGQVLDWVKTGIRKNELWGAISQSGEIIAVMWIEENGFFHEYPYLALIGVKKEYQGQGLGSFLLRVYEAIGRSLNKSKITLMVGDFNYRAKELYESVGYKEIGKVESAYMPTIAEYIMMKKIDN
ncbi:GNAT family N-acetyltransferase [Vagococcus carniphilus]|uniref:GNAT family N-acetyltransferase n=1 Tax=Vagococcus carniphilus TaxID=218144 RepID=A0A430B6U5_9ENTE|nr:GNAT family N-acetyltransferase [Vagococcus carniphilus]MDT2814483.1 GNAT family N-acetyltransferase [Vagococcus carniphilus]MDT2830550.1 GNAT family N-acetyltransferase [Vagococcus carniphilus]MDT2832596.1 GNAT family N-acetyltransferase [Vagococcus carniphilus]MDT2839848.1 GNAT family N-acetyltransferase [Vagococcus carniphilus]MDT2849763.1 GNAT family N-acetyltransferase [Vagococcus carniphilus]